MNRNKTSRFILVFTSALAIFLALGQENAIACSTFKLQKGNELLYCHNLNANGMDVPGMVFINKRGIFKRGRTWSELINKDQSNPSSLSWISKYGSVTFNTFGRDLPDGGMNEAGLYIWEMGLDTQYPKNATLPKLCQMHWMQYILDNFATLDEALRSAYEIEIDGWGWHYFVGDMDGNCASIEFINGEVIIHKADAMPVPGLFNAPYGREVELSRYFKGFGGFYEPALDDIRIPRFVKTAVMIKNYDPAQNAANYGFSMLKNLTVNEPPDWSVIFDARKRHVYFRTSPYTEIKKFSMDGFDFSNNGHVMILNMDIKDGVDVTDRFHPFTIEEVKSLIERLPLPEQFYGAGGLNKEEYANRLAYHTLPAASADNQYFAGVWKSKADPASKDLKEDNWELNLWTKGDAVSGEISNSNSTAAKTPLQHLLLIGNKLSFTFRTAKGTIIEVKALLEKDKITMHLFGIEDDFGTTVLYKP
jgi:hypothetical protein